MLANQQWSVAVPTFIYTVNLPHNQVFIGEGLKAIQLYSQQNTDRSFIEAFQEQLLHKSSHTVVALWYPEQDSVKKMKGK